MEKANLEHYHLRSELGPGGLVLLWCCPPACLDDDTVMTGR